MAFDANEEQLELIFVIKSLCSAGGAERVLADLASGLAILGHRVWVASYDQPQEPDFYPISPLVHRTRLGIGEIAGRSTLIDSYRRMKAVRHMVRALRPDVVIGFMNSAYSPLGFALAGTKVPLIGSEHIVYSHYKTRRIEGMLLHLAPFFSRALVAISEEMRRGFPRNIRRHMEVIPNPVAGPPLARADTTGRDGTRKVLLSAGRLVKQKDQAILIDAFASIAPHFPEWDLRILGDGPLRNRLTAQVADLGLTARISLPGVIPDISVEYLGAQLFAIPSRYESFGLVTAEALAHGLPAVGFADCPGTNEIIRHGENGLLVEGAERVATLAIALGKLMASKGLREEMAKTAPASVAAFAPENVISQWEHLLRRVSKRSASAAN